MINRTVIWIEQLLLYSSGDLLRAEVMSGSKRGQQLYMTMANGNAVPSEIVTDLLGEAMVAKADSKVIQNT